MKKIVHIITRLNIGGPAVHVVNLTKAMNDDYISILVSGAIESHESDMSYYAEKHNVPIKYLNKMSREIRFPADLVALWELYSLLRSEKPDIVCTHTAKAGTLGRLAAWLAGVPQIYHTFHGNIFRGYFSRVKTLFFINIEKMLSKITTKIIALSEKQKAELLELRIANKKKIEIIRLGFDFSHVLSEDCDIGSFRKTYNIPAETMIISIIGRITAIKNHKMFLKIADKLMKVQNLCFFIIGDGDQRDEIEAEISRLQLKDRVIVTGFITDLKPVFADTDIVLLTSLNEGTPVALIEAMVNKKLVITTNVGGVSDFIENGISGFYFDDFDPDKFVEKILEAIAGKIDTKTIGVNAHNTAIKMFSAERLLTEMDLLFKSYSK
jgi:glycosyltransferase involved in cell wall biosynthesis